MEDKRGLSTALVLALALAVCGCGGGDNDHRRLPIDDQPENLIWDETNWNEGVWQ